MSVMAVMRKKVAQALREQSLQDLVFRLKKMRKRSLTYSVVRPPRQNLRGIKVNMLAFFSHFFLTLG